MQIEFAIAGRTETTPIVTYHGQLVIADALHDLHKAAGTAEADALTAQITEAIRTGERSGHGQVCGRPYAWRIVEEQTPEQHWTHEITAEETEETEDTEQPDTGRTDRLAMFGRLVLNILENTEEWNSDTPDAIAEIAYQLKLAKNDEHGFFRKL